MSDPNQVVTERLDLACFNINMVKNSTAVSLSDHEVLTNLYTGQLIYVDDRDVSVAPWLMFLGLWEDHSGKVLRRLLSPGDVFFDIGANFGYFSLLAALEIAPRVGSLHLFEANPDLIRYLRRSLAVNGLTPYATLNNVAVAEREQTLTLNRIQDLWGGATVHDLDTLRSYRPIDDVFDAEFEVQAITIDSYVADNKVERVDFVKIDVEGFEDRVYQGMQATVAANPQMKLFLEFTSGAYEDTEEFFGQISSDFSHVYMAPDDLFGELVKIEKLSDVATHTSHEIAMLLFSNSEVA